MLKADVHKNMENGGSRELELPLLKQAMAVPRPQAKTEAFADASHDSEARSIDLIDRVAQAFLDVVFAICKSLSRPMANLVWND